MTTQAEPRSSEPIALAVGGMTCAGCASTIQRGLAQIAGVEVADVNVATRRATVRPDGTLDPEVLEDAMRASITGLGYQVLTPQRSADGVHAHGDHHEASHQHGSREHQAASEHEAHLHADASRASDLLGRLIIAAILTVPLLIISMVPAAQFSGWEWAVAALATPVILYAGWPFHVSTFRSARHGAVQMDTLITLGTLSAWTWSMTVLLAELEAHVYFETGAVIVTLLLVGKWLEVRSTSRAGEAIRALSGRVGAEVALEDGRVIPRGELQHGMRFVVRPGESIATDGRVVDGNAAVDASLVTGEPVPVAVGPGDDVIGGTIAADGSLTVEATRVGSETMLAQIAQLVDRALSGRARIQRLADRISAVFVPIVIGLSLATLAGWLLATGDADQAFTAAVAVLIISCPCALGLATPLAILVGTGRGAQLGVLVGGPEALEDSRAIQTIVLDKTGTLTEGRMEFAATHSLAADGERLLVAAASVEARSEHPVARAVSAVTEDRLSLKGFRSTPGQGVTATVQGAGPDGTDADVTVGSKRLFDGIPAELAAWALEREAEGHTVIYAGRGAAVGTGLLGGGAATRGSLVAETAIAVRDRIKDSSPRAVAAFRELGLEVVMLTGDNERAARAVASELGIDDVRAEVLPGEKAAVVEALQAGGRRVAMVGDGVNDAPALAQADLGIAVGTGADVAREASDLTIVSGDPLAIADAIALSRRTMRTIRGNLFWALAYNVAAIPLAALGVLNPMIAAGAMGASSLFVVGNSLRLRRFTGYRARSTNA
jgi:Cu+-exporting ATPase